MTISHPPIENILEATGDQFIALYRLTPSTKLSQDEFVKEFHKKQTLARNDIQELKKLGVTMEQLKNKLHEIIDKALQQYETIYDEWKALPWDERPDTDSLVDPGVIVDGIFTVKGLDPRLLLIQDMECPMCPTIISNPATCEIENSKSKKKILVPSMSLHFLEAHRYLAQGMYRIDPKKLVRYYLRTRVLISCAIFVPKGIYLWQKKS